MNLRRSTIVYLYYESWSSGQKHSCTSCNSKRHHTALPLRRSEKERWKDTQARATHRKFSRSKRLFSHPSYNSVGGGGHRLTQMRSDIAQTCSIIGVYGSLIEIQQRGLNWAMTHDVFSKINGHTVSLRIKG